MRLHHSSQRHGLAPTGAKIGKPRLGEVNVFEIVEVLQDSFASMIALASPGEPGELIEAAFDVGWKAQGEHRDQSSGRVAATHM